MGGAKADIYILSQWSLECSSGKTKADPDTIIRRPVIEDELEDAEKGVVNKSGGGRK